MVFVYFIVFLALVGVFWYILLILVYYIVFLLLFGVFWRNLFILTDFVVFLYWFLEIFCILLILAYFTVFYCYRVFCCFALGELLVSFVIICYFGFGGVVGLGGFRCCVVACVCVLAEMWLVWGWYKTEFVYFTGGLELCLWLLFVCGGFLVVV